MGTPQQTSSRKKSASLDEAPSESFETFSGSSQQQRRRQLLQPFKTDFSEYSDDAKQLCESLQSEQFAAEEEERGGEGGEEEEEQQQEERKGKNLKCDTSVKSSVQSAGGATSRGQICEPTCGAGSDVRHPFKGRNDIHQRLFPSETSTSLGSSYSNLCIADNGNLLACIEDSRKRHSTKPSDKDYDQSLASTSRQSMPMHASSGCSGSSASIATPSSAAKDKDLAAMRKTQFSKSASGSRLVSKASGKNRQSLICNCQMQDRCDRKHSHHHRRKLVEHVYESKQLLASPPEAHSFSTPLNRLDECDAITKRLLSSPLRRSPCEQELASKSADPTAEQRPAVRRASLGAETISDQVYSLFASETPASRLASQKASTRNNRSRGGYQSQSGQSGKPSKCWLSSPAQPSGRSLSVCTDGGNKELPLLSSRHPGALSTGSSSALPLAGSASSASRLDHSTANYYLNRAQSLACSSKVHERLHNIIPLFGCDIKLLEAQLYSQAGFILPPIIDSAIEHILANGTKSVGIFRKSGVKSRILSLKQRIEDNQDATSFGAIVASNEFSIYDIADLVKMWFRELKPVPLVSKELIKLVSGFLSSLPSLQAVATTKPAMMTSSASQQQQQARQAAEKQPLAIYSSQQPTSSSSTLIGTTFPSASCHASASYSPLFEPMPSSSSSSPAPPTIPMRPIATTKEQQKHCKSFDDSMPSLRISIDSLTSPLQRALLYRALSFLAQIAFECHQNQMTSQNLAICLTPSLCAAESLDQSSMTLAQRVLEYCIDNHQTLFG